MNRKLWTLLLAAIMVLAMSFTAFAADGVSADEQTLLDKFNGVVDKWSAVVNTETGNTWATHFKATAENALTQVTLDKAACDDLAAAIDAVDALLTEKKVATAADMKAVSADVVALVNKTSQKYGMTVSLDTVKQDAVITFDGNKIGSTKALVNKTGADLTATAAIVLVLAVAFATGLVLVRRQRMVAR